MTAESRRVRVEAPGGQAHDFVLAGDDTLVLLIDGVPAVGVDAQGAGYWPDGQTWRRLPDGCVTERSALVRDMNEQQYHGLAEYLGLPRAWFGRWRGSPGETRTIRLDATQWSCGTDERLDLAILHVRTQGLAYQQQWRLVRTVEAGCVDDERHEMYPASPERAEANERERRDAACEPKEGE